MSVFHGQRRYLLVHNLVLSYLLILFYFQGNFKELAYVYFSEPEVAKLASDSMNNYLMFDRRVRSSVLTEKIPPTILSGPRLIRTAPLPDRDKKMQAKQMCAKKDERGVIAFKVFPLSFIQFTPSNSRKNLQLQSTNRWSA